MGRFHALSIRNKLLAMVLLPLAGVLPLLGLLLLWWSNAAFDRLLITKIRADLAVAQGYFERVLAEVGTGTGAIADSHALALALRHGGDVTALLAAQGRRAGLDFIHWRPGESTPDGTSLAVLSPPEQAALLAPAQRARVAVPLVGTRNAAPTARTQEERAMVLLSSRTVHGDDGRPLGRVLGGVLLNRNLPFIDHINQIVYPEGSLPFGSQGTATLFLDDVRISTNVRLFGPSPDERAIGTRVSQAVRDAVLGRGQTWLDRAFVVNDWYVSAYEPLTDGRGQRVGMLYVGFLERPFTLLKYAALAGIGVVFFAVMIVAAVVSLRWARDIFGPVERMEATMQGVEGGDLGARVGAVASGDEIGRLARHLDHLLDVLQRWNAELDAKVAERTRELETAQGQLLRSEKLAAVGQLTASIAHEINNPIAVIQGNLDLVRTQLPPEVSDAARDELRLIDEQVERMRLIVTQLLQFARPAEYAGYMAPVDTARVAEDCLVLVGHLLSRTRITLVRDLRATRWPAINRNELQQVLVNLLVNAIHVMPEGGTLTLSSRDELGEDGAERVVLAVGDTGPGLEAALMDQLFKPFVTRKKDGTGLGLWISRSLVERYGGELLAANRAEGGACFSVVLRVDGGG
ncbi:MAG: cache domain-containing protein [Burkholderiaceae bacterium]|nr:cache domain-containing protein [Rhodoferax sp.]MCP5287055.1 cache domain-containing protein [Burkholderiaceae bacterium]